MTQAYSDPARESDTRSLPDIEVFHRTQRDFIRADADSCDGIQLADAMEFGSDRFTESAALAGWYWWCCFPGCMPEGDPMGPFSTEALALADAQEGTD